MISAAVLVMAMMLTAPLLGAAFTVTSVTVEMETSEDVLVMNSDVDLTFTVTDKDSGDPISDCQVEVHIDRKTDDGGNGHMHGEPVEVPAGVPAPAVDISVTRDPKAGWNLRTTTTNFDFAPRNASTENVWGEGHAHLYIDGVKVGRLYTEWYHIAGLDMGEHTVRVTLNTNDHMDLAVDGTQVEDSATFTETRDPAGHGHGMMPLYEVPDGVPTPGVQLTVHVDPKAGWNVEMVTTDYVWAPQNASTEPVMGEGHAHLYVDDHKVARVYGNWYYLGSMDAGEHTVRVTLNANNHSDYAKDGTVIEDSVTVTVDAPDDGHSSDSVTLSAVPGKEPGTYVVSHHFAKAGDYTIEVHVDGEGYDGVSKAFAVEVLEGDPAPLTIAGVILYVALAIGVIIAVQYVWTRRRVRRLQEASRQAERPDRD
jgi:hypothetical protein